MVVLNREKESGKKENNANYNSVQSANCISKIWGQHRRQDTECITVNRHPDKIRYSKSWYINALLSIFSTAIPYLTSMT